MALKITVGVGKFTDRGFTLIELSIVIATLMILTLIALPSYKSQQQAAKRLNAEKTLMLLAYKARNYHMQSGVVLPVNVFNIWLNELELEDDFAYELSYIESQNDLWFVAKALGNQQQDRCKDLYLSLANLKGSELSDGSCWNGKQNFRPR